MISPRQEAADCEHKVPEPLELIFTLRVIFFSFPLQRCLSLWQLMEEHKRVEHIQTGMCVPGKDLVPSAPSSSYSGEI